MYVGGMRVVCGRGEGGGSGTSEGGEMYVIRSAGEWYGSSL